jgi:hypothetical protein
MTGSPAPGNTWRGWYTTVWVLASLTALKGSGTYLSAAALPSHPDRAFIGPAARLKKAQALTGKFLFGPDCQGAEEKRLRTDFRRQGRARQATHVD